MLKQKSLTEQERLPQKRSAGEREIPQNYIDLHLHLDGAVDVYKRQGDVVAIGEKSRGSEKIKAVVEACGARPKPEWLSVNADTLEAKVVNLPTREQIDAPIEEHLIVEFYSK